MDDKEKALLGAAVLGVGGLAVWALLGQKKEKPPSPPKPQGTITITDVTFTPK